MNSTKNPRIKSYAHIVNFIFILRGEAYYGARTLCGMNLQDELDEKMENFVYKMEEEHEEYVSAIEEPEYTDETRCECSDCIRIFKTRKEKRRVIYE